MKLRIKNFKRLANSIVIIFSAFLVFYLSSATDTYSNTQPKKIIVAQGDTLWNIAKQNYPNGYLPKTTYEIETLNQIKNGTIYPGQILILP